MQRLDDGHHPLVLAVWDVGAVDSAANEVRDRHPDPILARCWHDDHVAPVGGPLASR